MTPVERHDALGIWIKRDDLYAVGGVRGGKVRTCLHLATRTPAAGLVTAGARHSPQVEIVAHIAQHLGLPCRAHVPAGARTMELLSAQWAGAELVTHRPGYNTVIVARAREDAAARPGWVEIPFGMECREAVHQTATEVPSIPDAVERVVMPEGSGMSLAGVLHGLGEAGRAEMPVLGVVVGASPLKRLVSYAPADWQKRVTLVPAGLPYGTPAPRTQIAPETGPLLDPIYEAKCLPFVRGGDLLWVVGVRGATS